jgi:hypothetical protein
MPVYKMRCEPTKEEINWNEDDARPILRWITQTKEEMWEEKGKRRSKM